MRSLCCLADEMFPFPGHQDKAIILYDGVCILCNGLVQFLLKRDTKDRFRFAPLQSKEVADWLNSSLGKELPEDTVVLWYDGSFYTKSDVSIQAIRLLPFPWPLLRFLAIIPGSWRDAVYDWIARNRYGWFGKKDQCPLPGPEERRRFISWPEQESE